MSVKTKIEIDTKVFVRFLLVVSGFVATVFLLWRLVPVLLLIAMSFFLAIALNKPVAQLARHMPGKSRVAATSLVYVVFITLLWLFVALVVPPIVKQTGIFIDSLPHFIEELSEQRGVVSTMITQYHLQDEINAFVQGVQSQAGSVAQGVGSNVLSGLSTLFNSFVAILTVLVLTFFMLVEGPRWTEQLWQFYSREDTRERHKQLVGKMYHVITGYVNGQLLVAAIAGALASLTLFILGMLFAVPASAVLPLGMIVFLMSLIPMIGGTISAVIVVLTLAFNDISAALIFLAYYLVYQQIEGNIIQPAVQSRTVELSALTILLSVIIGFVLLGVLGGILAIPVAGCIRVLLVDYIKQLRQKRSTDDGQQDCHEATTIVVE